MLPTPFSVKVDAAGRFAYVTNNAAGTVSIYSIDASTGKLTAAAPATVPDNNSPFKATFDPYGKFLLVANAFGPSVSVFSVNATTGALTPVAGSAFAVGSIAPVCVTVGPGGQFVYVGNEQGSDIAVFSLGTTGTLTPIEIIRAHGGGGAGPIAVAMTQGTSPVRFTPKLAYAANHDTTNISGFSVDPASGALAALAGSPFTTGATPRSMAVDLYGRFAYVVTEAATNNLLAYTINGSTGALAAAGAAISLFDIGDPNHQRSVTVDPSGRFVLAENWPDDSVYVFSINQTTGVLTAVAGSPFSVGFAGIATPDSGIAVDPTGRFVYAAEGETRIAALAMNAFTGALGTPAIAGSPYTQAGGGLGSIAIDPTGKFIFVTDANNTRLVRSPINAITGALTTPFAFVTVGTTPQSVSFDTAGRFLYAANLGSANVSAFTFNIASGATTAIAGQPFGAGTSPISIAVDPSANFALVANFGGTTLSTYTINQSNGALMPGSAVTVGTKPRAVVYTPSIQ